jgi:maleylacetoacetate isomerase
LRLYSFFRSSAAFRVRIALNLKGLRWESSAIDLVKGEHHTLQFEQVNPQRAIPALLDGNQTLIQSMAIVEYLEETHPDPPLLPATTGERSWVRAIAQLIACDIHPLNNLRVMKYLKKDLGVGQEQRDAWVRHWIGEGFSNLEAMIKRHPQTGPFCHGNSPTIADVFLVPQIFNARRAKMDLSAYPTLLRIFDSCMALPAFDLAQPMKQPDAREDYL